jgi:cytochrome P450 family 49 subfamily A
MRATRKTLTFSHFFSIHAQTSVAISSTMYQLSQNQDKQEKLYDELKNLLPNKDTPITPATLENMPFLRACIKETLRMYPVVLGNGRSLQSDAIIGGYNVPKGVSNIIFSRAEFMRKKFRY